MSTEIIISRRDEKKFNRLLGVNNSKRLFDIRNELCEKNPTISHDCAKVGSYPFIPMALIRVMRHFIVIRKWIKKQNSYYIKATHNEKALLAPFDGTITTEMLMAIRENLEYLQKGPFGVMRGK